MRTVFVPLVTRVTLLVALAAFLGAALAYLAPESQGRERRNVKAPPRHAAPHQVPKAKDDGVERDEQGRRIVYQKRTQVDFDSMLLEGDIKNPNEFYFVHRPQEKFGSLVKKRPNFHKEMLRDAVMVR